MKKLLFRPRKKPSANIAMGARSIGHYILKKNESGGEVKPFGQVYWGIKGRGVHTIKGVEQVMEENHIAVYYPGMLQNYRALDKEWEYRFCTFDGPIVKEIFETSGVLPGVYHCGVSPDSIFKQLEEIIQNYSFVIEKRCSSLAYELITHCHEKNMVNQKNELIDSVLIYIGESWYDKNLSVNDMALKFKIHRTTLSRKFQAVMKMTPNEYILKLRMQNAEIMLKQSYQTISQIAQLCGFDDPNYFSRIFSQKIGLSPKAFRQNG